MIGIASYRRRPPFDVVVIGFAAFQRRFRSKYGFGGFGSELAARVRGTGLEDDRPALNRTGDVKRPGDREMLALVVQRTHPGGVEIDALCCVHNEGIVGETVPQPGHNVMKLAGAVIARGVIWLGLQAEVAAAVRIRSGHHVPAGPPAADVIERGKAARDMERLVVSGRGRCDEADSLSHPGQCGKQREWLERGHSVAAHQRLAWQVEHAEVISHEEIIELGSFKAADEALDRCQAEVRVG